MKKNMKKAIRHLLTILILVFFVLPGQVFAKERTKINFWHAMSGEIGEVLNKIVTNFNKEQSDYQVLPTFKGYYQETLVAGIAAFQAKKNPHIIQVGETLQATVMASLGAFYPVYQLFEEQGTHIESETYIQAISDFYSDSEGQVLSLPFNTSMPMMYFNLDLIKKYGGNPEQLPKTWEELEILLTTLKKNGLEHPMSHSPNTYNPWAFLEDLHLRHNIPMATNQNGYLGRAQLIMDKSPLTLHMLTQWKEWIDKGYYHFQGISKTTFTQFFKGEIAVGIGSVGPAKTLPETVDFKVAASALPYWQRFANQAYSGTIGGASLWVFNGFSKDEYKGIYQFLQHLSQTKVQVQWSLGTGYMPVTPDAYKMIKTEGFYEKNPLVEKTILSKLSAARGKYSMGFRLPNYGAARVHLNSMFDDIGFGRKSVEEALKHYIALANAEITKY